MFTLKLTIANGKTKVYFQTSVKNNTIAENEEFLKGYIFNNLNFIVQQQEKLANLGAKNNFFGLSKFSKNVVSVELKNENETIENLVGIEFSLNQLSKMSNPKEAFNIIFDTQLFISESKFLMVTE